MAPASVDTVSLSILLATALMALPIEGVRGALRNLGAPSWQPVDDVVTSAVERLIDRGWLEARLSSAGGKAYLAPSAAARERLPFLLEGLALSASSSDMAYRLKVMGLDLLDHAQRARQLRQLLAHWQRMLALWQDAEDRCPCQQRSVRHWVKHNLMLARSEIDWLMSVQLGAETTARGLPP